MTDIDEFLEKQRLHFAAMEGDLQEVQRLIREGYPVSAFDELGKTPLHYATEKGHLHVAEYLLRAGADINAHDESKAGNTVLREVVRRCSLPTALFLLERGADPRIPGWMQVTALQEAELRKDSEGPKLVRAMWDAVKKMNRHQ